MSMTPVATSMCLVVAATAPSSGIGAEACGTKWWTRKDASFTPISFAAWAIQMSLGDLFRG